jgi:AbrB family looped-hinge helix DNA binding protein
MEHESRKITSEKFTITLPKDWREVLQLSPGDEIVPFYREDSPLVIIPSNRPLSEFEHLLVEMLVDGPTVQRAQDLIGRLESAKTFLESAVLAVA